MEVVYVITHAKQTGPVNQALNVLIGLNRIDGIHASLLTLEKENKENSWIYRFKDNGIDVIQFNLPKWNVLGCVAGLIKYIKEHRVDVVHSSGYKADMVNMMVRKVVKTVSTQRCLPTEVVEKLPKSIRPILEAYHLSIIRRIECVVACSKSLQYILNTDYKLNAMCVQNGVNTDYFVPLTSLQKEQLRKSLGLSRCKTLYLVLGSLRDRKNNSLIIEAFKRLDPLDGVAVIVGGGPEEDMLRELSKNTPTIIMAGPTDTPLNYLQACDILISASHAEGLPNTVLEALSCGLPCILSDIDPHKEIIEGTDAGLLFDRNDAADLCRCIQESKEWDMSQLSMSARTLAVNCFGIKNLAAQYESVYRNTVFAK